VSSMSSRSHQFGRPGWLLAALLVADQPAAPVAPHIFPATRFATPRIRLQHLAVAFDVRERSTASQQQPASSPRLPTVIYPDRSFHRAVESEETAIHRFASGSLYYTQVERSCDRTRAKTLK